MLISVIVTVYNIENYIARCIQSIQNQTYKELEIILVDDGSTDKSGEICDSYAKQDARIKVIHKKNSGPGGARNAGLNIAAGDYLTFVDGDDWIDNSMYEVLLGLISKHSADLAVCRYRCIYENGQKDASTDQIILYEKPYEILVQYLKEEESILIQQAVWNKLYRRSLLNQVRFEENKWYEDILFTTSVLTNTKKAVYCDQALYNYVCIRTGSIMNNGVNIRLFKELIPTLLEKEKSLSLLSDIEPVSIHRYYFYKKLLELYMQIHKKENKPFIKYKRSIIRIMNERKNTYQDLCELDIARKSDLIKIKIFLFSPCLYYIVESINTRWILPYKLRKVEK